MTAQLTQMQYSTSPGSQHQQQLQEHFQQFLPFQQDASNLPRSFVDGSSPNIFGPVGSHHFQGTNNYQGGSSPISNERLQQYQVASDGNYYSQANIQNQDLGYNPSMVATSAMNSLNQMQSGPNMFYHSKQTIIDTGQASNGGKTSTSPSRMAVDQFSPEMKSESSKTTREIPDIILTGAEEESHQESADDHASSHTPGNRSPGNHSPGNRTPTDQNPGSQTPSGPGGGGGGEGTDNGGGGSSGGSASGDPDSDGTGDNIHLDLSILPGGNKMDGVCNSILGCSPASSPGGTLLSQSGLPPTSSSPFDPEFFSSEEALKESGLYQDDDSLLMGFGGGENEDLFRLDHPDKMICDK